MVSSNNLREQQLVDMWAYKLRCCTLGYVHQGLLYGSQATMRLRQPSNPAQEAMQVLEKQYRCDEKGGSSDQPELCLR